MSTLRVDTLEEYTNANGVSLNSSLKLKQYTTAQRTALSSPAAGEMVYDTDLNRVFVHDGTVWRKTQALAGFDMDYLVVAGGGGGGDTDAAGGGAGGLITDTYSFANTNGVSLTISVGAAGGMSNVGASGISGVEPSTSGKGSGGPVITIPSGSYSIGLNEGTVASQITLFPLGSLSTPGPFGLYSTHPGTFTIGVPIVTVTGGDTFVMTGSGRPVKILLTGGIPISLIGSTFTSRISGISL